MQVEKSSIVKVLVDSVSHCVAYAKYGTKSVGTWTQMGNLPKKLQRVSLLLKWISVGISRTVNFYLFCLYFYALTRSNRLNQITNNLKASTCSYLLKQLLVEIRNLNNYLDIINGRTVVQCDKCYVLVATLGAYPTFCSDFAANFIGAEQILNLKSSSGLHDDLKL